METPQQKKGRGTDEYSGHLKHEVRGRGREGGVGGRGRGLGSGEDGGVFLELVSQFMLVPVPLLHSSLFCGAVMALHVSVLGYPLSTTGYNGDQ